MKGRGHFFAASAEAKALTGGWTLVQTPAGACQRPDAVPRTGAISAPVPGTVAAALEAASLFDRANPEPLQDRDAWYFLDLHDEPAGPAVLRFEGLATVTEIYLNDALVRNAESMFETFDVPVQLAGYDRLALCFRALKPLLETRGPRARWRPRLMNNQGLRLFRTTLLGAMPGWCPEIEPVGPFRPVTLLRPGARTVSDVLLTSSLLPDGATGRLSLRFRSQDTTASFRLCCNGQSAEVLASGEGEFTATLEVSGIEPWWPHTHGTPRLYPVTLEGAGTSLPLGQSGFRAIEIDRDADGKGFGLRVNGIAVFCRGAVWTNADIVRLPGGAADYRPILEKAAEAGMNMIRIGGTMTYESADFFRCCDELGLLVWQDVMLANFDYPAKDQAFLDHIGREMRDLLMPIGASPSLAVLCGGSEVYQQAAMLGLPQTAWQGPLTEELLPELARQYRPDVAYVPNSPFGGAMPFSPGEGVTHYYGVGAYERPLEDARRANVRFSSESLAFSQVPQQATLDRHLPFSPVHDPRWKVRVPRDRDASWDFEDTRDHYLQRLYGLDPARLRREDVARYLDLSRAVTGEVSEEVFAEWRRQGSTCRGGLVWTLLDLMPGPGWGVIDATGGAKPIFYALKRAFRPLQVLLIDEGTNGLDVHMLNERAEPADLILELVALRDGSVPVVRGQRELILAPRETTHIAATDLFGAFFDTTYAFRFGPPSHDVTVARLRCKTTGATLSEAFHFPLGRMQAMHLARIEASLVQEEGGWSLLLETDRFAQSVHVASDDHRALDDWFHLVPGTQKRVPLAARKGTDPATLPSGTVTCLGSKTSVRF